MEFIVSIFVALAVAFGSPATAPTEAPVQQAVQVVQETSEEQVLRVDAEQTIIDHNVKAPETGYTFVAQYVRSIDETPTRETFGLGEFAYESIDLKGVFHIYRWSIVYSA